MSWPPAASTRSGTTPASPPSPPTDSPPTPNHIWRRLPTSGQNPTPQRLSIARWVKQRVPTEIVGGTPATVAGITSTVTRLVSGTGATGNITLPTSRTGDDLVGIGGATAGITISEEGSTAATAIATALQVAFRGETFAGAGSITVTIEGAGAQARFVITVPAGVSIRAAGLTGNLADALGFIAGDDPRYESPFVMSVGGNSATVNVVLSGSGGVLLTAQTDIATALQAALRTAAPAGFNSLTATYDSVSARFEIGDGTVAPDPIADLGAPESGPLADALGLSTIRGAEVHTGSADQESASEFLDAVAVLSDTWYWVVLARGEDGIGDTDAAAFSAALESTDANYRKQLIYDVVSPAPPSSNDIARAGRSRTVLIWSATQDYKSAALAGQFAARDLNRAGTALTAKFRPLTGRAADSLTPAQVTSLDAQRINYYTDFGGSAVLAEGVSTAAGRFVETQHWIDWFTHQVQVEIYALLRSSNRVPQTAAGVSQLKRRVNDVCRLGVDNGGIAPGLVSNSVANAIRSSARLPDFDGELHHGYLIHIDPVTRLTDAQRQEGRVPTIHVWVKGSGAVHFVDLDLTFGG